MDERTQNTNNTSARSSDVIHSRESSAVGLKGGVTPSETSRREHSRSNSNDDDPGAIDDLLDDYNYTSQPNTPGMPPVEYTLKEEMPSTKDSAMTSSMTKLDNGNA